MASHIIGFLRNETTDLKNRRIVDLQGMKNEKLEKEHDYIQWMFPTDVPSKCNPLSPVLTEEDIAIIKDDKIIQSVIMDSVDRMCKFYDTSSTWVTPNNHNFLRITRILRCLWVAGLKHEYVMFSRALDDIYIEHSHIIGEDTFYYWKNANNDDFMKNGTPLMFQTKYKDNKSESFRTH